MYNKQITNNKTLDKRNPPPLTVSCAPSGDEGPTVYIQTKERKKKQQNKNNLFHVQIIIPVGCQNSAVYVEPKKFSQRQAKEVRNKKRRRIYYLFIYLISFTVPQP
jgi:rRNA processing protein Gar1